MIYRPHSLRAINKSVSHILEKTCDGCGQGTPIPSNGFWVCPTCGMCSSGEKDRAVYEVSQPNFVSKKDEKYIPPLVRNRKQFFVATNTPKSALFHRLEKQQMKEFLRVEKPQIDLYGHYERLCKEFHIQLPIAFFLKSALSYRSEFKYKKNALKAAVFFVFTCKQYNSMIPVKKVLDFLKISHRPYSQMYSKICQKSPPALQSPHQSELQLIQNTVAQFKLGEVIQNSAIQVLQNKITQITAIKAPLRAGTALALALEDHPEFGIPMTRICEFLHINQSSVANKKRTYLTRLRSSTTFTAIASSHLSVTPTKAFTDYFVAKPNDKSKLEPKITPHPHVCHRKFVRTFQFINPSLFSPKKAPCPVLSHSSVLLTQFSAFFTTRSPSHPQYFRSPG